MRLRVVFALLGTTFIASCICLTSADPDLADGHSDKRTELQRLRGENTNQADDTQPALSPLTTGSNPSSSENKLAAGSDTKKLTPEQKTKMRQTLSGLNGEERAYAMSTILLWSGIAGLVAGTGAIALLRHKRDSFVNGVASPPVMSASHSSPGTASGNMSGSASGSMSGSASGSMSGSASESMSGSASESMSGFASDSMSGSSESMSGSGSAGLWDFAFE